MPKKFDAKELFIGNYDWGFLCAPRIPFVGKPKEPPPLYGPDDKISLFIAAIMGAQHALAMVGGIITVPLLIAGNFTGAFTPDGQGYLIAAALIVSGIASLIQVSQFKIPFTKYVVGSGLLSVMGISFTFLPIAESSIGIMKACSCVLPGDKGGSPCIVTDHPQTLLPFQTACTTCTGKLVGSCLSGEDAYGKFLGTLLVCCWLESLFAFIPHRALRRIFPPVVTGVTVILIGVSLVGVGFKYWGGGVYCGDQVLTSKPLCSNNGEVQLPFGSPQYIGLGFVVFSTLLLIELFGSPFMRNTSVVIGLLVGMIVASATSLHQCNTKCGDPVCKSTCYDVLPVGLSYNATSKSVYGKAGALPANSTVCLTGACADPVCNTSCASNRYVTSKQIDGAKWVTFLWVHTFKLGFFAPAVLPCLFSFMVTTMECVGDVTATAEASGLAPYGERLEKAIQGGILADGLNCFWGALGTMMPVTTFAQNNGVISLTRCGARRAGVACAIWLILLGVFAKFAAVILTIPDCVLGGMTTFLFVNVVVSGIRILNLGEGINRRNRFIAAMSLAIGLGVNLAPAWVNISGQFEYPEEGNLWPINPKWSSGVLGIRNAIIIVMSNGFSVGGFIAVFLNLILPHEIGDVAEIDHEKIAMEAQASSLPTDAPKTVVI